MSDVSLNEPLTDIALAFGLGCELFDYFSSVEIAWQTNPEHAKRQIHGRLVRSRRMMSEYLDQLRDLSHVKQELVNRFVAELSAFEKKLAEAFEDEVTNRLRMQIEEIRFFIGSEFAPNDLPNQESEELDSMINGLFSEIRTKQLKQSLVSLERAARQLVQADTTVLTFYRLGFESVRPTEPLYLDDIFSVEPNCLQDEDHKQSVISSRRKLFEDASDLHIELRRIELHLSSNGYQLRDQIFEALKIPREEFVEYGLGLVLYPQKMLFSRNGRSHVCLKDEPALWSLLEGVAPSTKGAIFKKKQDLEAVYEQRDMKPKIKNGKEHERNPIPNAIHRLNKSLSNVSLRLGFRNGSYEIFDCEED